MSDFPRRMRDWLFNVMNDLAQNDEFPAQYKTLQNEAETNLTRRWANAAIWKWCDLDGHTRSFSFIARTIANPCSIDFIRALHCAIPSIIASIFLLYLNILNMTNYCIPG